MVKITCPVCDGSGRVPDISLHGPMAYLGPNGESWPHKPCPACGGTGIQEISDEAYVKGH